MSLLSNQGDSSFMKQRIFALIIFLIIGIIGLSKHTNIYGDEPLKGSNNPAQMEQDEAEMRGSAPMFRFGMTFPGMITMMDSEIDYYYNKGIGFFLDWMYWRSRNEWGNGFDLYTRITYRYFWSSDSILEREDDFVYQDNMIHILSIDAGIRLVFGTYMFGQAWQVYVAVAPRFLYFRARGEESRYGTSHPDSTTNLGSIGIIGAMGFEVTIFKWLGIFTELNVGYCPVGDSRRNVEGLTLFVGLTYRTSFLDSEVSE